MKHRETSLVTTEAARGLVVSGRQDAAILKMWADKHNTHDIARVLTVHESFVARRLLVILRREK